MAVANGRDIALTSGAVKILGDSRRQAAQRTLAAAVPIGNRTSKSPSRGHRYSYVANRLSPRTPESVQDPSIDRSAATPQHNATSRESWYGSGACYPPIPSWGDPPPID